MHCLLCGTPDPTHGTYPTPTVKDLARSRYAPGPLIYPRLMSWTEPTVCVCRLCFHQLRRRKKAAKKQPLPMDATLLQSLMPGQMRQQDTRTRGRMCAALLTPGNGYSRSFAGLRTLLQADHLHPWWAHNLQTEFFAHKSTARLIRRAIRPSCGL